MKKICFSCPTVFLKRPIAEIISRLNEFSTELFIPYNIITGYLNIHCDKLKDGKINAYPSINLPFLSSEWPIPLNPFIFIKLIKVFLKNDIIHSWVPFYINNTLISIMKRLFFRNKRYILTMDTFPALSFKTGKITDLLFKIYYKTIGRLTFSAADKIVIYTKSMKHLAIEAGIPRNKIIVIPTGIDVKMKKREKNIREEFNIALDEKIILFVGLFVPRKGIDLILKVAEKLKDYKVRFILVGDGPMKGQCQKFIEENHLQSKIIFTGYRRDVHNFYHDCDLFFFPSRGEGLPGVIMESMVYGVAVISSNIPGTKDLIQNNYNGFLCELEDINCYVEKIKLLLQNNELRERFIKNSKEIIRKRFNWEKNIELFKELYK